MLMRFQRRNFFEQARHIHRFSVEGTAARGDSLTSVLRAALGHRLRKSGRTR
jgi:hypothetical protein